jgi:hypothetical protein
MTIVEVADFQDTRLPYLIFGIPHRFVWNGWYQYVINTDGYEDPAFVHQMSRTINCQLAQLTKSFTLWLSLSYVLLMYVR